MVTSFPEPVLTITPAAVRDLQGREALSGLWTLFTKCKESLQDGRRLENISWRLWYREIMRDGSSPDGSPVVSRIGSSEGLSRFLEKQGQQELAEMKADIAEVKEKEMEREKASHSIPSPESIPPQPSPSPIPTPLGSIPLPQLPASPATTHTSTSPSVAPSLMPTLKSTPGSPPPAYAFGMEFAPKKLEEARRDERIREREQGSPVRASSSAATRKNHAHPLTPSASQTSVDSSADAAPGQQARSTTSSHRPSLSTTSSTSSVPHASSSPNSKPRRPSQRRRRSSFVNGSEEEPVNVGMIICEMLPSSGLEASDVAPVRSPFPSHSLSHSSRATSPASSVISSNMPTLAVNISDTIQEQHESSSSTPTAAVAGLAYPDLAKLAASTLPTPEIEVAEEDTMPAPPRAGGARYPLIVPSPQTSPPRPHHHQQSQGGHGTPPVIPPIIAPGGVQPPQLVIVTPTPGATPHPTPPATPLVGWGVGGGRMYGQYLIVPKSSGSGRTKTRGGDGEGDGDGEDASTDEDDEEEDDEDYTDSDDDDYEDVDDESVADAPRISGESTATQLTAPSQPSHSESTYSSTGGANEKRVSISSAISDRSTTSNTSSNTTHSTSSAETRDTEESFQPVETRRDKGKQKETTPASEEQGGSDDSDSDLHDTDAIVEELDAEYARALQSRYPAYALEQAPAAAGNEETVSTVTMKGGISEAASNVQTEQAAPTQSQVQPSKPILSVHTKRRSPVIAARSGKGLRGGFVSGKTKSLSRSRSQNREEAQRSIDSLVMTASAVAPSPPVDALKSDPVVSPVAAPSRPVVAPPPLKLSTPGPPAPAPAATPPVARGATSPPPPPSPTFSVQSTSSNGRGRSRNIIAIGRGAVGSSGRGKRRGGLAALRRRMSGDSRKTAKDGNGDEDVDDEDELVVEDGPSKPGGEKGPKETAIEMDAHDMLDEVVNPQAKIERSESTPAIPVIASQSTAGPINPAEIQAIVAHIQVEEPRQNESAVATESRAPVRFNIGSNSEDGTGSASASGSASMGRSGSAGFRSGSGSGSRTRGGMLRRRFEKAKARAVSRSVEEEREATGEDEQKSDLRGGVPTQPAVVEQPPPTSEPAAPVVRPLLQPIANRKGGRQLEELLKMEQRSHQLASRQVSAVALEGRLPPVIAPLAPSPRPNARSPSQGRGKSPRTRSTMSQRAGTSRSSGSGSKNLQDPQLMKVLSHVMDLTSNGNRLKKVVLATSESEEDDEDDYETETDVDQAGFVAALSPSQQRVFADQMAAAQSAPQDVQEQSNDDDEWSSATDDVDESSPPNQVRPRASPSHRDQRTSQQPPVRPAAVQRTYSSHYPAGRTGRDVKQQLAEQQRQQQQYLLQQQQQQQQQQQNARRSKSQRDTIEITRLPSESFQNLALAKLRNNSIGGLTRLLNPGLDEEQLLSTVRRGYSSGDILKESPMRRVPTGGTIGGMHGLRPLTSAQPSMAPLPAMQPRFAPMAGAAPPSHWNREVDPRVTPNLPPQPSNYMPGRPPLARRHTEHTIGPTVDAVRAPEPSVAPAPAVTSTPLPPAAPPADPAPRVAAPPLSKSRSVAAIGSQPHRRQSSTSTTTSALRPAGLLTKFHKSFIAPASTTVSVSSLATDRASPAEINPKSSNTLYSKVAPDATSRFRALNAIHNSGKPTPVAKSPPTASPITTSSSAPADAVLAEAIAQQETPAPVLAPPIAPVLHESVTAPNGANVVVGLDGYGGAGRYQRKGPPPGVEMETDDDDEDGMYEDESSDHESVAEFQTERQKQIAASLACSLSADPILDDPVPPRAPAGSKTGKSDKSSTQDRVRKPTPQRSPGKVGNSVARRGGKSVERGKGQQGSSANVAGAVAGPGTAYQRVESTVGAVTSGGEGSQQRRLPKTLQFTQIAAVEQPPTRQASRQALQQTQARPPVQPVQEYAQPPPRQQQFPPGQQQALQQQQEILQLQQQLQQLQQLQFQRQTQQQQQQHHHQQQQQQQQHYQQQQFLQNAQQPYPYQPQGPPQFGYPQQHAHPQPPPHFYPQAGPANHPGYAPIPYTQSQQHFPTQSLQQLGFPYNLPVQALPSTPRTTRRDMVKTELSESVRQGVVIGRKITKLNQGRRTSMGEDADAEWRRRPLTAAPSMVQLLPKGTLKAMGVAEEDQPRTSAKGKGPVAEPDPAMRRALQHSRNKSWADTTHTSGW